MLRTAFIIVCTLYTHSHTHKSARAAQTAHDQAENVRMHGITLFVCAFRTCPRVVQHEYATASGEQHTFVASAFASIMLCVNMHTYTTLVCVSLCACERVCALHKTPLCPLYDLVLQRQHVISFLPYRCSLAVHFYVPGG